MVSKRDEYLSCTNTNILFLKRAKSLIRIRFRSGFQEEDIANDILNEEDDLQNLLLPLINVNVLPNAE